MLTNFQYDSSENTTKPNKRDMRVFRIIMILNLIGGVGILIRHILQLEAGASFFLGICFILSGIFLMIFDMKNFQPLFKKGLIYVRLEQGVLTYKLSRFGKEKSLNFSDIKNVSLEKNKVLFHLFNNEVHYLQIERIVNFDKRSAFEKIINDLRNSI